MGCFVPFFRTVEKGRRSNPIRCSDLSVRQPAATRALLLTCALLITSLHWKANPVTAGKDGPYWLDLNSGVQRVYCEMSTHGGGWTLFLSAALGVDILASV